MIGLDPDMVDVYQDPTTKGERREKKRLSKVKKPGPTSSDKRQHAAQIRAAHKTRLEEAREKLRRTLLKHHFSREAQQEDRLNRYIDWVKDSLSQGYPLLKEEEIQFQGTTASGPGGQHLQRKRTAVRAIHLPTAFFVRNEEERSSERNKSLAREALLRILEDHLKLWQTINKDSLHPIDVAKIALDLLSKED